MSGESYRFVPTAGALNAFFRRYEQERQRSGIATGLAHVSPQQRIDTIVTILGLNSAGGWRQNAGETGGEVWLRYLTPVLAETRDSAAALAAAIEGGLPGRFEPELPTQPGLPPKPHPPLPPWQPLPPDPWWQTLPPLVLEYARTVLRDPRILGAAAVVLVALGLGLWFVGRDSGPIVSAPPTNPVVSVEPKRADSAVEPIGTSPGPDDAPLDEAGRGYRAALQVTLEAATEQQGSITPIELARVYAAESAVIDDPGLFLAAMLRDWPLPPDRAIPRDRDGAYALTRYAATFDALERGDPYAVDRPALDRNATEDQTLRDDVTAFGIGDDTATEPEPPAVQPALSWPDWLKWLAFLPMLGVAAWARLTQLSAFRALLTNPEVGATGIATSLPAETLTLTDPRPARKLTRQISWREPGAARRINAAASIRSTIRNGGYLTLVPRLRRRTSDFLFLVPRLRDNDHEYERTARLIDSLRRGGLSITVYDYAPDPRTLTPSAIGRPRAVADTVLDLRAVRELHADARLVLVTDGAELVDYFTSRPLPFVAEELAAWPSRMLLTPVPIAEWGEREMNLGVALNALVGRAGPESFADLALAFGEHPKAPPEASRLEPTDLAEGADRASVARVLSWVDAAERLLGGRAAAADRPRSIRLADPMLTSDAEPPDDFQAELVDGLRSWLGPLGFTWLAACAAYPQLRFAITVYLGLRIVVERGPVREPLYTEPGLAQLSLLPWFRAGRMPPWLRRALFAALTAPQRVRVRAAIDDMLTGAGHTDFADLPHEAQLPIWRQAAMGVEIPADAVMADLLFRDRAEVDPVIRGGAFSAIFRDVAVRAQQLRLMLLGAGLIWCLIAFLLVPAPGPAPQPIGHWLPLVLYVVATAVIGGVCGILWFFRRPLATATQREATT
ncbi:MAG TPA: hypothetical protein VGV07_02735 [Devosia sp.]|jgi:hypothetical protein|uniref:hypothetical protein n=1 Tax=Devosia sp. TaxID=1871048 RepID=UPI002DDD53DE|nr:hypothetical protein [Devosia sp.]HEV2514141.1 hypothetical protein [Devosia sp.]